MSNDYRNCEGYPDPTAGEALSRIAANEKQSLRAFRPIVYICSPFSGDVETNVANARRYSRYAVDKGFATSKPHVTEISSFVVGAGVLADRPVQGKSDDREQRNVPMIALNIPIRSRAKYQ